MSEERTIFVNLPVNDLNASKAFFAGLGFEFDPRFTSEDAAAMKIGGGSSTTAEAIVSVSASSREAVDEMVGKALGSGGKESLEPIEMPGMYGWGFQDLDGHLWEVLFMDMSAIPAA